MRFLNWFGLSILVTMLALACTREDYQDLPSSDSVETVFRLGKSSYEANGTKGGMETDARYDKLFYYITDNEGNVIDNVKSYYDSESGVIKAEGLHEGEYRLIVLGIDGDDSKDGVVVNNISHVDEDWIVFPESARTPLNAEYYYSQTDFVVRTITGSDGKLQEVADIPDMIPQKRIITRIDFTFDFDNIYVANSVVSQTASTDGPRFYTRFSGNGTYGGSTDGNLSDINLMDRNQCLFMPLVKGSAFNGKIVMNTRNYLNEDRTQSYEFSIRGSEANRIYRLNTAVEHPDNRLATMFITEKAMESGEFSKILQDDEPISVYTDRNERSFNTAKPLQVSVTDEGKLHIRFYSPRDLKGVLVKAKVPAVGDEFFDLAYFNNVPAFADFLELVPATQKSMMVRMESGRYVEIRELSAADFQGASFKIESDDDYWDRLTRIEHGWTLYWGLFGGDPTKEDGGPVGNWMGIRPVHCRESVAFFLNFTFMIDMPEHEEILRANADQLYDDNKQPVRVEDVLAKMRRNQTLQVGLVYPGNGVIGLGSPSVFGAYQRGWFEHYFNTYACSVMFHELGHVMGYGHASSFTYGPWAEQLMNNFYVNNIDKMPVNSINYLNSSKNPNIYE